jgi:hypothetical protein
MARAVLHPLRPLDSVSILCSSQGSRAPREPAGAHPRKGRAFRVLLNDIEHMDLPRTEGAMAVLALMEDFVAGVEAEG